MSARNRRAGLVLGLVGLLGLTACGGQEPPTPAAPVVSPVPPSPPTDLQTPPAPVPPGTPAASESGAAQSRRSRPPRVVDTIATDLEAPWGLAFLPDGDAIVTERDSARVLRISATDRRVSEVGRLDLASPGGEGGLLGVAVSPEFAEDSTLYFYATTDDDNRIVRARLRPGGTGRLGRADTLLSGIPDAQIHDGGRLEFGSDGFLYASTGDAGIPELAADLDSLGGKVLRITTDGEPAPGNPFDSEVYSYGHRNVQGLAFDPGGRLWASEFGQDAYDELNRIDAGADYGWPEVEGPGGAGLGYTEPQTTWSTDEASPSGLAYADGSLWMAALRGSRLWQIPLEGDRAGEPRAFFVGDYGRMRTVTRAPDGSLWVTTSNTDGRGDPAAGDDRILMVRP